MNRLMIGRVRAGLIQGTSSDTVDIHADSAHFAEHPSGRNTAAPGSMGLGQTATSSAKRFPRLRTRDAGAGENSKREDNWG